jgi:hypothetical protein
MATYKWDGSTWVDKKTGEAIHLPHEGKVCAPIVRSDIPEYRSPIDGTLISSRSTRREDLKKNGCVEWEPGMSKRPGGIGNPKFAAKHGLPLSEAAVHRERPKRIDPLAALKQEA